ncbi:MAG: roadblock/LC7 domain-containing protein [Gemmatimonadaceae bacterium]
MPADDIRAMSEMLAADPSSLVFLQLGEALRRRGELDVALRVAARGAERHPTLPGAHDLVARIASDRGELEQAVTEWERVLQFEPAHAGARKGLGYVCFQLGRLEEAAAHLGAALVADPADSSLTAALDTVRSALQHRTDASERATIPVKRSALPADVDRPVPVATLRGLPPIAEAPTEPGRATTGLPRQEGPSDTDTGAVFDDLLEGQRSAALLLDADGLVLAGRYVSADGRDLAADIGAQLSGISDEASRAMRHLGLGAWTQIVFETEAASVAMAPSQEGVLLVAAARPIPLGFVRRVLDRALARARAWMEGA